MSTGGHRYTAYQLPKLDARFYLVNVFLTWRNVDIDRRRETEGEGVVYSTTWQFNGHLIGLSDVLLRIWFWFEGRAHTLRPREAKNILCAVLQKHPTTIIVQEVECVGVEDGCIKQWIVFVMGRSRGDGWGSDSDFHTRAINHSANYQYSRRNVLSLRSTYFSFTTPYFNFL